VLLVGPTGALADAVGLSAALLCLACLLIAGLACALALPDAWKRHAPASVTEPVTG